MSGKNLMQRCLVAGVATASVCASFVPAQAEDIDLFVQPAGVTAGLPNVLIILDNTANWNQPFVNEKAALVNTVNGLPVTATNGARFRLGLMLFTETGNPNSNADGGYIRAAIRDLDSTNKALYSALVNSLHDLNDKSNGGKAGKTMAEAYQYFGGLAPLTGNNKVKTDYTGNVSGTLQSRNIYALGNNALSAFDGSPYRSPLVNGSCAGNYIIYISNGAVQDNSSDNSTATTWLQTAATAANISNATTAIPLSPSGSQSNVADEWARFMKKSPLAITTYTVDVDRVTNGQGPGWTALLKSMASVSGGKYFDVASGNGGAQIADALGRIFSEIQAVDSVFASVSLPVSVNNQYTYLNQVYVGMFRPDRDAFPRWAGNLKQYKLGLFNNNLRTVDADGNPAINAVSGFITECARSFWTPTTADSYWAFRPQGDCTISGVNYDNSNYPDGRTVEKGAQAFTRRASTTRTVTTCSSVFASCSAAGALLTFNDTNVTQAALGAASSSERDTLISWHRGLDMDDENINSTTSGEMRASVHGDVVHSRPIAINYNTDVSPMVVVFYGANDGVFRAINGNQSASIGSFSPGHEMWAFSPPEFHSRIKRLRDNNTQINFQGNPTVNPTPLPKPYGMAGAMTFSDGSLYVGMRRGGRALYAFNVNKLADPTPTAAECPSPQSFVTGVGCAPALLWKTGCPNLGDDTDCAATMSGIGQTWSAPVVMKPQGYTVGGVRRPVVIMGGGYDNCEDADVPTSTCKSSAKGRAVYVFDAVDGTRLNTLVTERPVVADVFEVSDANGDALWAYVADLGGNVYRISGATANAPIGGTAPGAWTMTKIAALGCNGGSTSCTVNRKFMFMPDIVEDNGTFYLMLGSGDREKPLTAWPSSNSVANKFFMLIDNPTQSGWLTGACPSSNQDLICTDTLLQIGRNDPTPAASALASKKGWYLDLASTEQVVTSAITVFGNVTFSTHTPTVPVQGACTSNLGTPRVYNVNYLNAAPRPGQNRFATITGTRVGLPPSPVAGTVRLNPSDPTTEYPFIIGANPGSPLEAELPPPPATGTQPRSLTYWYVER